ncbi:MAG: hypothetical protein FWB90_00735 [Fibromonadales bacterium]|nr:hypothetical protein [Fibromonadales bacterium]
MFKKKKRIPAIIFLMKSGDKHAVMNVDCEMIANVLKCVTNEINASFIHYYNIDDSISSFVKISEIESISMVDIPQRYIETCVKGLNSPTGWGIIKVAKMEGEND